MLILKKLKIIYKLKDKLIINLKIKYRVDYSLVETKKIFKTIYFKCFDKARRNRGRLFKFELFEQANKKRNIPMMT
ncbi:MAG: hypothetical protein L6U99_08370 [Clostridium sp.]|nr:MAG: hypothetical protein L6U99_08370 [Clostridium sp.]